MLVVDKDSVKLVNCTFIGKQDMLQAGVLEDCYIIPKSEMSNITSLFQGRMIIETKPSYEV